jgi:signal transduction histidine kinase
MSAAPPGEEGPTMTAVAGGWHRLAAAGGARLAWARGALDTPAGDVGICAATVLALIALLAVQRQLTAQPGHLLAAGLGVGACSCPVARRRHPLLAALAGGALGGGLALIAADTDADAFSLLFVPVFLLAYSLGADRRVVRAVAALLVLGAGVQAAAWPWNPFVVVALVGPFALGVTSRSRSALADQLAVRGRELAAEEQLFAAEAARYERLRIARELHDIVAHSVSVMVIQAAAGQRLARRDPALAAEAFDTISAVARQADAEIEQLVDLLDSDKPAGDDGLRLIAELVTRAAATGLVVGCRFDVAAEQLSARAAQTAYRVVQESLTNALKHAPGAPVQITVSRNAARQLQLSIASGQSAARRSGLETSGAGRGLAGMRERVTECGGEFSVGPADGGWLVTASIPADC